MERNFLKYKSKNIKSADEIKKAFERVVEKQPTKFANTEASLIWIIRGTIDFFADLSEDFLGEGNETGIPTEKADHFANNFYRLSNSLNTLAKFWGVPIKEIEEWNILKDLRTLIVHSGEQITRVSSIELQNYKDAQLGRIYKRGCSLIHNDEYDYCLSIWTDKHDKFKTRHENEVDYDLQQGNYRDVYFYVNAVDVRRIVLDYVWLFISLADKLELKEKPIKLIPEALKDKITNDLDLDKLEEFIKSRKRGGYIIENNKHYWQGFG
ncbi:MAG: hypothetical protein ACRC17_00780, partial [Culicoidibacterales bacterium]